MYGGARVRRGMLMFVANYRLYDLQLAIEDRSMNELFTATSGACPAWDDAAGAIAPGDCMNGAPAPAGILSNPHVMKHFFSNLAFRRVRWLQETFACAPFPAEFGEPVDVGGANPYTAPWPFESIAGTDNGGTVDFHDTSAVVCANCHATMNHIAPLFAQFNPAVSCEHHTGGQAHTEHSTD